MKNSKALTKDQVIKKLKRAAANWQAPSYAKDKKAPSYRSVAGPYKVREGVFESRRFYFNPQWMVATSYGWWSMLAVHNGKLVRNECGYSPQTSVHQSMLDAALKALGIKPDLVLSTRANIRDAETIQCDFLGRWAEEWVKVKYAREPRTYWLKTLEKDMRRIEKAKIGVRFSKAAKARAIKAAEERRASALQWKRERAVTLSNIKAVTEGSPINVVIMPLAEYGKFSAVGHHCRPAEIRDVKRSLERAVHNNFPNLFIYVRRKSSVSIAATPVNPRLSLVRG